MVFTCAFCHTRVENLLKWPACWYQIVDFFESDTKEVPDDKICTNYENGIIAFVEKSLSKRHYI